MQLKMHSKLVTLLALLACIALADNFYATTDWSQYDREELFDTGDTMFSVVDGKATFYDSRVNQMIKSAEMKPAFYSYQYNLYYSEEIPESGRAHRTDDLNYLELGNVKLIASVFDEKGWTDTFPFASEQGYTYDLFLRTAARFPKFCGEGRVNAPNMLTMEDVCRREISSWAAYIITASGHENSFYSGFTDLGTGEAELCEKNFAFCELDFKKYDGQSDQESLEKELDKIDFGPVKLRGKELLRFLFSFMGYGSTFEGDQRFRLNLSSIPVVGMTSALWRYMTPSPLHLLQETTDKSVQTQASMHDIATKMISDSYLDNFGAIHLLALQFAGIENGQQEFDDECLDVANNNSVMVTNYAQLLTIFELEPEEVLNCIANKVPADLSAKGRDVYWEIDSLNGQDYRCNVNAGDGVGPERFELPPSVGSIFEPEGLQVCLCQKNFMPDLSFRQRRQLSDSYDQIQRYLNEDCVLKTHESCQWYYTKTDNELYEETYNVYPIVETVGKLTSELRKNLPKCRNWNEKPSTYHLSRGLVDLSLGNEELSTDGYIMHLIKDNFGRTPAQEEFREMNRIYNDIELGNKAPADMYMAKSLGQKTLIIAIGDADESNHEYTEFDDIVYPYDSSPFGNWTFEVAACIKRGQDEILSLDCSLPLMRIILNVQDPCEMQDPDLEVYPQCDPCNIEPVDFDLYPQCIPDPCEGEFVDFNVYPQCDPCQQEDVDYEVQTQCDPCAAEVVDYDRFFQCNPCDRETDFDRFPQCAPAIQVQVVINTPPSFQDFDPSPNVVKQTFTAFEDEAEDDRDDEKEGQEDEEDERGGQEDDEEDEVEVKQYIVRLPPIRDPDPDDKVTVTVDLNSSLRRWIDFDPDDMALYLYPVSEVAPTSYPIKVQLSDGKSVTDYTITIQVLEADPPKEIIQIIEEIEEEPEVEEVDENEDEPEGEDQDGDESEIDDQEGSDEDEKDDQSFNSTPIKPIAEIEEKPEDQEPEEEELDFEEEELLKEAEEIDSAVDDILAAVVSDFDPQTLWNLQKELTFLQPKFQADTAQEDNENVDGTATKVKKGKPQSDIQKMGSNGLLTVKFSQKMFIKELFDKFDLLNAPPEESILSSFKQQSDYRRLQEVPETKESQVKMSSLFVVYLERGSLASADYSKLGFSSTIDNYDETSFTVKVEFKNPKSVSIGSIPDEIILQFRQPELFVSKETSKPIVVKADEKVKIKSGIPRQFEDSGEQEAVKQTSESVETITNVALAVNFVIAIFLTVSLKAMWSLNHMIQLLVFLLLVVQWPENTKIVIEALENATSLSFVTEPVFALLTPQFEFLQDKQEEWKYDIAADGIKGNQIKALAIYGLTFFVLLLLVLIYFIARFMVRNGHCITVKNKLEATLFHSSWLRWVIESCIEVVYTALFTLYLKTDVVTPAGFIGAIVQCAQLFIILAFIPLAIYWLAWNREQLERADYIAKYGTLYQGVQMDNKLKKLIYIPVFVAKRYTMVLCLWYLQDDPTWQILAFNAIYSAKFVYLVHSMPQESFVHNFLEIFNEIGFVYLHYFMLFFNYGDFVAPRVQWNAGKAAAGIIVGMYAVNFGYLVIFILGESKRIARLKKIKFTNQAVHTAKERMRAKRKKLHERQESKIESKQLTSTESCEANRVELAKIQKRKKEQAQRHKETSRLLNLASMYGSAKSSYSSQSVAMAQKKKKSERNVKQDKNDGSRSERNILLGGQQSQPACSSRQPSQLEIIEEEDSRQQWVTPFTMKAEWVDSSEEISDGIADEHNQERSHKKTDAKLLLVQNSFSSFDY